MPARRNQGRTLGQDRPRPVLPLGGGKGGENRRLEDRLGGRLRSGRLEGLRDRLGLLGGLVGDGAALLRSRTGRAGIVRGGSVAAGWTGACGAGAATAAGCGAGEGAASTGAETDA